MREGKSEFLLAIARKYDSRIISVSFNHLNPEIYKSFRGMVWKPKPPYDDGFFRIEIDPAYAICEHQILHTLYHEIGHVVLGHCDPTPSLKSPECESQAEDWAFRETGLMDKNGRVRNGNEACYLCISRQSKTCLKDFHLTAWKNGLLEWEMDLCTWKI